MKYSMLSSIIWSYSKITWYDPPMEYIELIMILLIVIVQVTTKDSHFSNIISVHQNFINGYADKIEATKKYRFT